MDELAGKIPNLEEPSGIVSENDKIPEWTTIKPSPNGDPWRDRGSLGSREASIYA